MSFKKLKKKKHFSLCDINYFKFDLHSQKHKQVYEQWEGEDSNGV